MLSTLHPPATSLAFTASVDQVGEAEWSNLLDLFRDASLYQTWAYGAVSWGEKQLSHLVLQREGQPVAMAQLRLVRLPLFGRGAAYLRWGPVCARFEQGWDGEVFEAASRALVEEYVHRRRLLLRVLPHQFELDAISPTIRRVWQQLGLRLERAVKPYCTMRVDLSAPLETIRKRLDGKWRNQLNAAERNGLALAEGTSDDLYQQFLGLYRDMMARKQFETTVDPEEFRRIQARLPARQKLLVLISRKEGRPTTGLVGSVVGETGIYLLGATSTDGMKSKGSYLLQWRMMQHLKERGCRWYDLGGVNPDKNPGVFHFKQGMGGGEVCGLGRFALSGDLLSTAAVTTAERLRSFVAKFKRWQSSGRCPPSAARSQ